MGTWPCPAIHPLLVEPLPTVQGWLSTFDAIQVAHQVKNIYTLALNRRISPTPDLGGTEDGVVYNIWTLLTLVIHKSYCSVSLSRPTLCGPMDCSTPGSPVLHFLPEFAQIHVH